MNEQKIYNKIIAPDIRRDLGFLYALLIFHSIDK